MHGAQAFLVALTVTLGVAGATATPAESGAAGADPAGVTAGLSTVPQRLQNCAAASFGVPHLLQ